MPSSITKTVHVEFWTTSSSPPTTLWWYYRGSKLRRCHDKVSLPYATSSKTICYLIYTSSPQMTSPSPLSSPHLSLYVDWHLNNIHCGDFAKSLFWVSIHLLENIDSLRQCSSSGHYKHYKNWKIAIKWIIIIIIIIYKMYWY